jgi:ubiquinone/menaquinone biosynthesis C-methylase UbiE
MSQQKQLERWQQLEESTAEAYERYLVPLLFAPGAQFLTELAALGPGERVLDVACGTGIVARTAASRVGDAGQVAGLDASESMLKVARKASSEVQPAIEWKKGDAGEIPFPEAAFDVVFCQQGLQFFSDRPAVLGEMRRVLAPNGRLALSVLRSIEHNPGWALFAEVLEHHVGPDAGGIMRLPFPSLSTDELRDLIASVGFQDVRIFIGIGPVRYPSAEEFFRWEVTSWLLAKPLDSLKGDVRLALICDLKEALRVYTDDEGIVFPAGTYLAVARQ